MDRLPPERLQQVFRHPSLTEDRSDSYERLEFLGDSVLGFIIARALFEDYPRFTEGQLSKIRAHVVSRRSCAVVARELGLHDRLVLQEGITEELLRSTNVLAALMESLLAALYLEFGLDAIGGPVVRSFAHRIEQALTVPVDYKTSLQEVLAKRGQRVTYETLEVEGPPHDRTFRCAAVVDGEQLGVGAGTTKKAAEQEAALVALERLGHDTIAV